MRYSLLLMVFAFAACQSDVKEMKTLISEKTKTIPTADQNAGIQSSIAKEGKETVENKNPGIQSTVVVHESKDSLESDGVKTEVPEQGPGIQSTVVSTKKLDIADEDAAGIQSPVKDIDSDIGPVMFDDVMEDDVGLVVPQTGQVVAHPNTNLGGAVVADEVAKQHGVELEKESEHIRARRLIGFGFPRFGGYRGGYGGFGRRGFGGYGRYGYG